MSDPELHPAVPDDFDRRDDQSMWTGQYAREGEYPQTSQPDQPNSDDKASSKRVYGPNQLLIADNDRTAQDQHARQDEENRLRAEGLTDEEKKGAEIARRWLEDHK